MEVHASTLSKMLFFLAANIIWYNIANSVSAVPMNINYKVGSEHYNAIPDIASGVNYSVLSNNKLKTDTAREIGANCPCGGVGGRKGRISMGQTAEEGKYPWVLRISIKLFNDRTRTCTASLIHSSYVLTAGHCLVEKKYAVVPKERICLSHKFDSCANRMDIEKVIVHEEFKDDLDSNTNPVIYNDIALIKLKTPLSLTQFSPVCLSSEDLVLKYDVVLSAGWGATHSDGTLANSLQESKFMSAEMDWNPPCKGDYFCIINKWYSPTAICFGDSGGPVMKQKDGKLVLVGVISFGDNPKCATFITFITKVSPYYQWIREHMDPISEC